MCVIHSDAVEEFAARQNGVPYIFEAGDSTAALVINLRVAVENFKELVVPHLLEFVCRNRPPEIGMIDVRYPSCVTDGIHIALDSLDHTLSTLRLDHSLDVKAIDVDGFITEVVTNLFSPDDEELFIGAVERVEAVDAGQEVMVGEHEKLIAVFTVPADHLVRR
jgi:hypothetical protein